MEMLELAGKTHDESRQGEAYDPLVKDLGTLKNAFT
jgi:hypothetical protein